MAKERVFVDEREVVAGIKMGKSMNRISLKADDIAEVIIGSMEVKKLFKKAKMGTISFRMKKAPMPTVIVEDKGDAGYWEGYKSQIARFCKKNRIKFTDPSGSVVVE